MDGFQTPKVLGVYTSGYYKGKPGLISKRTGKGQTFYFGAVFTEQAAGAFLETLGFAAPYSDVISADKACELAVREKDGDKYMFILNYANHAVKIDLKRQMSDVFAGGDANGEVTLAPYETKVYKF